MTDQSVRSTLQPSPSSGRNPSTTPTTDEPEMRLQDWATKLRASLPQFLKVMIRRAETEANDGGSGPCRHSFTIQAENGVVFMTGIFRSSTNDEDAIYVAADEAIASVLPYHFSLRSRSGNQTYLEAVVRPVDPVLLAEADEADMVPVFASPRHINFQRRSDNKVVLTGDVLWSEAGIQSFIDSMDGLIPVLVRKMPSDDLYFFMCDEDITIHSISASNMTTSLEFATVTESTLSLCAMRNLYRVSK